MNGKELIFGGAVRAIGGGAWRDSSQDWLPIKNIMGGVVVPRDNRFIKILEVLPEDDRGQHRPDRRGGSKRRHPTPLL